ncbi:interleukin-12 subunit alpha isoform X1 [Festucalex cinctus]
MANLYFYLLSCLLVTSALKWRTSTSLPMRAQQQECAKCSELFASLLSNIRGLFSNNVTCYGLMFKRVIVSSSAETVRACAPNVQQNSSCMPQRSTAFSESECVTSIMKDVAHYDALIGSYLKAKLKNPEEETALLSTTREIIHNLKSCFLSVNGGMSSTEEATTSHTWDDNDSFKNRLNMCKMLRGFHMRAITINRAMGYMSSGDHRK